MSQYALMSSKHLTAPDPNEKGWPKGIKYIVGNEGAERFSFYGMKAILFIHLFALIQATGLADKVADANATASVHLFVAGVYAFPILGALLADKLLGKYNTILWLSIVYCLGHLFLALFEGSLEGTYAGLALIAVGAGGIKPCVSAHVGDQFGKSNWHLITKVFQLFYFMINFGSLLAYLLIPELNRTYGPGVAFGVPGILMAVATFMFWLGRREFVHVPASPGGKLGFLDVLVGFFLFVPLAILLFADGVGLTILWQKLAVSAGSVVVSLVIFDYRQRIEEDDGFLPVLLYSIKVRLGFQEVPKAIVLGKDKSEGDEPKSKSTISSHWFFGPASTKFGTEAAEGPLAVFRVISVFFLISVFWMLFDQQGSTWIVQAKLMDRDLGFWTVLPSQMGGVNAVMVMILIPITLAFFSLLERRGIVVRPLKKISVGMVMAALSFVAIAIIQSKVESAGTHQLPVDGEWKEFLVWAGVDLQVGNVSVAWQFIPYAIITLSEVLVSVTGLEFAYTQAPKRMKSIVMGFWLLCVSFGNFFVSKLAHTWEGWELSKSFWVFAGLMFAAAVLFAIRASFYTYKEYTQDS